MVLGAFDTPFIGKWLLSALLLPVHSMYYLLRLSERQIQITHQTQDARRGMELSHVTWTA